MDVKVSLTFKQIYDKLCPKCQKRLIELAKENIAVDQVENAIKGQVEAKGD